MFFGYSYLWQDGNAKEETLPGSETPDGVTPFKNNRVGITESLTYYFGPHFGWQVDNGNHDTFVDTGSDNNGYSTSGVGTVQTGPIWRLSNGPVVPFVHGLVGGAYLHGPAHQPYKWGPTYTAGLGFDVKTGWRALSIRLIQADYEYFHASWGPPIGTFSPGGRANANAARLSSGLVFHFGSIAPPPPVTLACSASPESVFAGDPVTVTATAGSLDPKLNAVYAWSGQGVTGTEATAQVATAGQAPGTYTVNGTVKEGKPGKEGLQPWQTANCSTTYVVRAYEPPTVTCSANPGTIKPGENSTITAAGVSPQNRPLTYSYSVDAGTISGSGTTATYASTGAPTGNATVTCTVTDDKGQTASAQTTVAITSPYVAPAPHTQTLCSINFSNDKKRPLRVDNEAKACLDEVALDLQRQPDAKAVLVGDATDTEKAGPKHHGKHARAEEFAAQRAVNTKAYLVDEKGIDASRISVATGTTDAPKVENYLVPSGASFTSDVSGTTPVDESVVKPQARKPLAAAAHHHAKKAAQ